MRHVRTEPLPGADPGDAAIPRPRGRRSEGQRGDRRHPGTAHCWAELSQPHSHAGPARAGASRQVVAGRAGIEPASLSPRSKRGAPYRQSNRPIEPPIGFEPMPCRVQAGRSPAELQGHIVTLVAKRNASRNGLKKTRRARSPRQPSPIACRAANGRSLLHFTGTLGGSRTRINLALNQARLPDCGTSAWSPCPEPNGDRTLTRRRLCH